MTAPEERHRYQEQIGAFLLGKLDGGERAALQAHLNGCSVCQAEVGELKPVVAALADATLGRTEEPPEPPEDLEEQTLAPILGEIYRARRRRGRLQGSALAAAAICVVVIGLAGFTWHLESAVALEPLSFSVAHDVEVKGHLIEHASGTEIRLVASGLRDGQTYRVTLVSEDGERVDSGTFIGIGDKPVRGTFNAALLREEADRLEVRTPGGEPVFFAKLPEEPRDTVRDWPLFGILPWADPDLRNETMGSSGSEGTEGPIAEDPAALPDTQKKPKAVGTGSGTPHKESPPASDPKRSSPGGEKPGAASPGVASPGVASPGAASPGAASEERESRRRPYGGSPADGQY